MTTMAGTATRGWTGIGDGTLGGGAERVNVARNVLLFFAAPFIGLAYIVALPFVGVAVLAKAALLGR